MKTNGTHVGPSAYYSPIPRYIGTRKISDLPIFPSRFLPNEQQVFSRLEGRGRSCLLCEGHKRYDDFPRDIGGRPSHNRVNGDVYVDPGEYYGSRKRADEPRLGFLPIQTPVGGEIEEIVERSSVRYWLDHDVDRQRSDIFLANDIQNPEKLRLMSHQVVAFAFRPRKWVRLEIEQVKEIDKSDTARNSGWEDLTISTKYRRLLVSLVDSHTSDTSQLAQNPSRDTPALNQLDLVRGKGMGLNILLHGPPGTGKTSTAETIAAYTGRSLYSITCGDLGTTARDVESRLNKHTDRAGKWGSVLLLDEADVFLMKRDYKDTQRNALVSVFLRVIEYYSGILFLTTNRVGVIDEAFKSRMHVSLRYPKIRLPQTREIWKGCLDRIQRDNETREIKVEFDRHDLLEFAEEHYNEHRGRHATWNGRQIRNAFQTAIAMGEYERVSKIKRKGLTTEEALAKGKRKYRVVQLTRKNLETIAETAQEFEKYMKSVHRLPDADLAKKEELRDDDFSEPSVDLAPVEKHSRRRVATGKSLHKKKPAKTAASSTAQPSASHGNKTAVADEDSSSEESTYGQGQQEASSDSSDSEED
ncbi:P-loop containing nucleoside triphosphate hydrolase protein [Xylariomycetidae sp. FL0641]|nr:P-loop containing nucleoside triphosphate hydrolase protein [Xylariomycetidae sp. FL0641]